uniref:CSON002890 protein n=1 Tax=Culicoides sonorensis TaxID=179676 RepID=A0A336MLJ1_CULSO
MKFYYTTNYKYSGTTFGFLELNWNRTLSMSSLIFILYYCSDLIIAPQDKIEKMIQTKYVK